MPPAEYCRSGFHSGQSASGYFDESIGIFLGGTDRTRKTTFESLEVTERTGEAPNECVCDVRGFQPTKLQEIKIYNGGIDVGVPLFRGHLQLVEQDGKQAAQRPIFHLTATDYSGCSIATRCHEDVPQSRREHDCRRHPRHLYGRRVCAGLSAAEPRGHHEISFTQDARERSPPPARGRLRRDDCASITRSPSASSTAQHRCKQQHRPDRDANATSGSSNMWSIRRSGARA
jgi:hypothetical protein